MRICDCQKCGNDKGYLESRFLFGGYSTRICVECLNKWHQYIYTMPQFRQVKIHDAKRAAAIMSGDEASAANHQTIIDDLRDDFFSIGRDWMASE